MSTTRRIAFALALVLSCISSAASFADEPNASAEYGLAVGKKMPFHVADFVNGRVREGCPSVMISNAKSRGVIIWTRDGDDSAFRLAKALDGKLVAGAKLLGFLVAFDKSTEQLKEQANGIEQIAVGKSRRAAKEEFEGRGVDAQVRVLVFFTDRKDIKAMWSFTADELTNATIGQLAKDADAFAADGQ